ncbi:unnamed protein product [Candida verbasci]|uniref:Alkaline phosphatase n=1 Tax=Candida verbasci TaxID=1227364 RepID=A0A9W4TST3_9ASCO|nr:unnamed protein product [Candida verbasci]
MAFVFPKILKISALALLTYLYLFSDFVVSAPVDNSKPKKQNIIFFVGDGLGQSGVTLARTYRQIRDELSSNDLLEMDKYLIGTQRTSSNSSLITDSAAAGTALATGFKTINGRISVDPEGNPVGAIGEALKLQGYKIGLVVTTSVCDATPSVWLSHALNRGSQDLIAEQMVGEIHPLGRIADIVLGGGKGWFYGIDDGGFREDNRSIIDEMNANGTWTFIDTREEFDNLDEGRNVQLPLIGLFADDDYPYRIDRDDSVHPNLVEQTKVALQALSNATEDEDQGFFIMIESSRIDHAGHANDSPAHVLETLEYDEAIKYVYDWVQNTTTDTIVIATADHETGGLNLKANGAAEFEYILNATQSAEYLVSELKNFENSDNTDELYEFVRSEIFENGLGLTNYTDEEVSRIAEIAGRNTSYSSTDGVILSNITSSRAGTDWGSVQHTFVDVGLYAFSNAEHLRQAAMNVRTGLAGYHENTDFSVFIKSITDINLDDVTEEIADIALAY